MTIHTRPALAEETIGTDEAAVAAAFVEFLKATSTKHHPTGAVPRFNQGRAAGCVDAEFIVPDGLPQDLRVGLFAHPRTYKARIRFAQRHIGVGQGARRSRHVDQGVRRRVART